MTMIVQVIVINQSGKESTTKRDNGAGSLVRGHIRVEVPVLSFAPCPMYYTIRRMVWNIFSVAFKYERLCFATKHTFRRYPVVYVDVLTIEQCR